MNHFNFKNNILHAEDVNIADIVAVTGTPVYIYSSATLARHAQVFKAAFSKRDILICFAVKANANISVLATLAAEGLGADVVSEGEIRKALMAGISPNKIVFSGVGKTDEELTFAIQSKIYQINVESEGELIRISKIAHSLNTVMPIVLRLNPDIGAGGHDKITTGKEDNKFGVSFADVKRLYKMATEMSHVKPHGLAVHIGSQIFDLDPLKQAFIKLRDLAQDLRDEGYDVTHLDLGGGLGVPYEFDQPSPPEPLEYAQMIEQIFADFDVKLAFEPGRMIAGNAGILVTKVIDVKNRPTKKFAVVDAGMNDLMRPAMYEAFHHIEPVNCHEDKDQLFLTDVVGPVCESSDIFASNRMLPNLDINDLFAIFTTGAYGTTMAGTYNLRRMVPEVMVKGNEFAVVRQRQTWEELLNTDCFAHWQS